LSFPPAHADGKFASIVIWLTPAKLVGLKPVKLNIEEL